MVPSGTAEPIYAAAALILVKERREAEWATTPFFLLVGDLGGAARYGSRMKDTDDLMTELAACEERVWGALVEGDPTADDEMLDADFMGVYATGFASKADHTGQLADGPTITRYKLTDHRVLRLDDAHAVLSYRADFLRVGQHMTEAMYISSIWRHGAEGWRNIFSQDTTARE